MIHFLLRYIYFLFIFVFLFLLYFKGNLAGDVRSFFIISYGIILIPIIDSFIEFFKGEKVFSQNKVFLLFQKCVQKYNVSSKIITYKGYIFAISLTLGFIYIFWENIGALVMMGLLFGSIFLKIDARIIFFIALLLLLGVPISLLLEYQDLAEKLSLYMYYFLIVGVVVSVFEGENIRGKISSVVQKILHFVKNIYLGIKNNYQDSLYDMIFLFVFVFIGSLYFEFLYGFLLNAFYFLGVFYLGVKFFGFKFLPGEKQSIFQIKNINILTILFSLHIIVFSALFSKIDGDISSLYLWGFICFSFLVFLSFTGDFLEKTKIFFRKYSYVTFTTITMLGIIFGSIYKENIGEFFSHQEDIIQDLEEIIENFEQEEYQDIIEQEDIIITPEIVVPSFDISLFQENIGVGSQGESVENLQRFLNFEGYYNFSIDGNYDGNTQVAMRRFLADKCQWPIDNQGILGPLGRECIGEYLSNQK